MASQRFAPHHQRYAQSPATPRRTIVAGTVGIALGFTSFMPGTVFAAPDAAATPPAAASSSSVTVLAQDETTPTHPIDPNWIPVEVPSDQPLPDDPTLHTDSCPFREHTPPAVDESETVHPGTTSPTPIPVNKDPEGGKKLQSCGVIVPEGFKVPERLTVGSWLIYDVDSGDVIAAEDPHGRYRPASIFKVLLAREAIDRLPLDKVLTATQEDANMEGSRAGIGPDGKYTVRQALQGLLMRSGNDCAHLLMRALGGEKKVLADLQKRADGLGTQDTRVTSYSGLDAPGLQTSAYDLALLYREAFHNTTFNEIVNTKLVDFPGYQDNPGFQISNDNDMLFNYDGAFGGKTGFTDDARHTYSGGAERDGRKLAVIELNATNAAGKGWDQATRLLDAAWPVHKSVGYLVGSPAATTAGKNEGFSGDGTEENRSSSHRGNELRQHPKAFGITAGIVVLVIIAAVWSVRRGRRRK
ncbi:serine hydrolase [uncultured Corynebacterium sp.]|uniref:D-alanyl-D-alanine carboxypeptidase family protein n=1 Tax=uncultured Corynebacterium sp. TaxID=159447 RepID=UPI0025EEBE35|nr:serine hydrolase [uncultured Corynebacterium sp.]